MKRIVYTVATGRRRFGEMAMGLARSLSLIGDTTPRVIVTDIEGFNWKRHFDEVLKPAGPRSALDKLTALERTDADQILSLDVDMLAFKRLAPIFEYCDGRPLAVQGFEDTSGSFHGVPVPQVCDTYGVRSIPRFNGGMIYYERHPDFEESLAAMREAESNYDRLGFDPFRSTQRVSEEVCVMHALLTVGKFHLIPQALDFQHSAAGLIGKLHLDVATNTCRYVCRQESLRYHEPYIFHAWRYKDFFNYWRQIDKLERFERFEDERGTMYLPRLHRIGRSIQRRFLRLKGRA